MAFLYRAEQYKGLRVTKKNTLSYTSDVSKTTQILTVNKSYLT